MIVFFLVKWGVECTFDYVWYRTFIYRWIGLRDSLKFIRPHYFLHEWCYIMFDVHMTSILCENILRYKNPQEDQSSYRCTTDFFSMLKWFLFYLVYSESKEAISQLIWRKNYPFFAANSNCLYWVRKVQLNMGIKRP